MSIVVDASVALKWVNDEAGSDAALQLRRDELIAPVLWLAEAANGLWRRVRIGEMSADEANVRITALMDAPVVSFPIEVLIEPALTLGAEIDHPVYDCIYLALALLRDTHVITADRRFAAAVAHRTDLADRVRLLGT